MKPLLTVIMATFNSENTIKKTLDSVLNQSFLNFEFIIIDGNSVDETLTITKKYEPLFKGKNIGFKWISEVDSGIYNAWNKGLKLATGKWISFLGSDDIYLGKALEKYALCAENNPEKDFIYSKIKIYRDKNFIREIKKEWEWKTFKKYMELAHVGAFHNKKYFKMYGNFDENFKIAGDYEMLLRAKNKLQTFFIDEFTVIMQDGGISNNMVSKAFKEAKKAKIKTGEINLITANLEYVIIYFKYLGGKILRKLNLK